MDLSAINSLAGIGKLPGVTGSGEASSITGMLAEKSEKAEGTLFEAFFQSAIDNINTTNSYLSNAENENLKWALGQTENTHDLTIALGKANTALQYTIAIRDKVLEAYRELMQIQI